MTTIPAWMPVTLAAAVFQVWRTALQAKLRSELSPWGAGFVRYLYALPVDMGMATLLLWWFHESLPHMSGFFLFLCLGGGIAQIIGTTLLIITFGLRNFVVGTAYAKTEAAQLVIISVLVLGIHLPPFAIVGIFLAVIGVLMLSLSSRDVGLFGWIKGAIQPAAWCGLGAAFAFGMTALALRAASLSLGDGIPVLIKASLVLLVTNLAQTLVQGSFMLMSMPKELQNCLRLWRSAAPVGILSALGSGCWFTAFTLAQVALVRGLGQVEILFTVAVGHLYLKERLHRIEMMGVMLVAVGVLLIGMADLH